MAPTTLISTNSTATPEGRAGSSRISMHIIEILSSLTAPLLSRKEFLAALTQNVIKARKAVKAFSISLKARFFSLVEIVICPTNWE